MRADEGAHEGGGHGLDRCSAVDYFELRAGINELEICRSDFGQRSDPIDCRLGVAL
jgi:hypothetical protein